MMISAAAIAFVAATAVSQVPYDYLIRRGTVVDGTGETAYVADVALRGDRIIAVSRTPLDTTSARTVIDATDRIVAPGFIDVHAHVEQLAERPLAESFVRQGVTTVIHAPDGGMPWPLGERVARLESGGHAPNTAFFAGHNTIRRAVLRSADRTPTPPELERMKAMVDRAMNEGAIGLSTGLRYVPGTYSTTEEVIALARVAAAKGGIYASHIRDEGAGSIDAVRELIRIAREAEIPAQLTHHKLMRDRKSVV